MKRKLCSLVYVLAVAAMLALSLPAQTSQMIPFSGTAPGQPDGSPDLTFKLYDAASGGNYLGYSDPQPAGSVTISGESYSAVLGAGNGGPVPVAPWAGNPSVYVAIELTASPGVEIGPRVPLYASGYALSAQTAVNAQNAGSLGGVPASGFIQTAGGSMSGSSASPILDVTNAGSGAGLTVSSTSGRGITATNANSTGVYGVSSGGTDNAGVQGVSTALNGNGVIGEANNGPNAYGVWGKSTSGIGVKGTTNAAGTFTNAGVVGVSTGNNGIGVLGQATARIPGLSTVKPIPALPAISTARSKSPPITPGPYMCARMETVSRRPIFSSEPITRQGLIRPPS